MLFLLFCVIWQKWLGQQMSIVVCNLLFFMNQIYLFLDTILNVKLWHCFPDSENNGIFFLLLKFVKWLYFCNFTVYSFLLLLDDFIYFRLWRNLPCKFSCKKLSSQRMCWELDLISLCGLYMAALITEVLIPYFGAWEETTVLLRLCSIRSSVLICAKAVGPRWRNFSQRKQSERCLTLPLKCSPSHAWAWLCNTSQFLSQN